MFVMKPLIIIDEPPQADELAILARVTFISNFILVTRASLTAH